MSLELTKEVLELHTLQTNSPNFKQRLIRQYIDNTYPPPPNSPCEKRDIHDETADTTFSSPSFSRKEVQRKSLVASMRDKEGQLKSTRFVHFCTAYVHYL
jgi:hypothetical protein